MIVVNLRGTNGAGKSSIPFSMEDDPKKEIITKPYHDRPRKILTVYPSYGWVVLGAYKLRSGGMDRFDDTALIKKSFWYALKKYPDYNLIMEGIICSTVFSTYRDLFLEAEAKYPNVQVHVVHLLPPLEVCIQRVQERNGGKEVKEDLIADKYGKVQRTVQTFKDAGLNSWAWDNSHTTDEKLIYQLEDEIRKHGGKI